MERSIIVQDCFMEGERKVLVYSKAQVDRGCLLLCSPKDSHWAGCQKKIKEGEIHCREVLLRLVRMGEFPKVIGRKTLGNGQPKIKTLKEV